jgi:hypothetical protein
MELTFEKEKKQLPLDSIIQLVNIIRGILFSPRKLIFGQNW